MALFGSRARGQAQQDSDYDIAVFLRDLEDREAEMNRLADIATDILYHDGEFVLEKRQTTRAPSVLG